MRLLQVLFSLLFLLSLLLNLSEIQSVSTDSVDHLYLLFVVVLVSIDFLLLGRLILFNLFINLIFIQIDENFFQGGVFVDLCSKQLGDGICELVSVDEFPTHCLRSHFSQSLDQR